VTLEAEPVSPGEALSGKSGKLSYFDLRMTYINSFSLIE